MRAEWPDQLRNGRRWSASRLPMTGWACHDDDVRDRNTALARAEAQDLILSAEQAEALAHVTDGRNPWIIIGHAGMGKIAMLDVA